MDESSKLTYALPKGLATGRIRLDIEDAWSNALKRDPALRQRLTELGIDPSTAQLPYEVEVQQGADGMALGIMLTPWAAQLGYRIATDVWEKFILPRLIARYGHSAFEKVVTTSRAADK